MCYLWFPWDFLISVASCSTDRFERNEATAVRRLGVLFDCLALDDWWSFGVQPLPCCLDCTFGLSPLSLAPSLPLSATLPGTRYCASVSASLTFSEGFLNFFSSSPEVNVLFCSSDRRTEEFPGKILVDFVRETPKNVGTIVQCTRQMFDTHMYTCMFVDETNESRDSIRKYYAPSID